LRRRRAEDVVMGEDSNEDQENGYFGRMKGRRGKGATVKL